MDAERQAEQPMGTHFRLEPEAGTTCLVMNCGSCKVSGYIVGDKIECPLCSRSIHIEYARGIRNALRQEMLSGTFDPWERDKIDEMIRARYPEEAWRFDILGVLYEGSGRFKEGWYFGERRSIPRRA